MHVQFQIDALIKVDSSDHVHMQLLYAVSLNFVTINVWLYTCNFQTTYSI